MPIKSALSLLTGASALALGMPAHADTRSSEAIPEASRNDKAPAATSTPRGPKNGFPDTPGLARAREVANERARFLRNDSTG